MPSCISPSAEDEDERKAFLKKHAGQLRTHVDQLAKKEYWRQFERSPEFVVAFIPGESLLAAACEADPGLQDHALGKGIVLATPNTLVAALKTIALSWQQETLAENAREVRQLGAELYERLRTMTGHMESLQRNLSSTVEAYNKAVGSFSHACSSPPASSPPSESWGCSPARSTSSRRSRRRPAICRPTSPTSTTTSRANRPSWRSRRVAPAPARRSPHPALRAGGWPEPFAREHRRRTLPGCCTSIAPIAPTPWCRCCPHLVAEPLAGPMTPRSSPYRPRASSAGSASAWQPDWASRPEPHDGVCANIDFPFPGTLIAGALARATGNDPKADPWMPERSVWPLMEVVEEHFDEEWLAPLADHIRNAGAVPDEDAAGTPPPAERFSIVRHVADLFDRYSVHRPDMVQRWALGAPLPDEAAWQVELWRLLRARIDRPSPAEHLENACAGSGKTPTSSTCRTGSRCSA